MGKKEVRETSYLSIHIRYYMSLDISILGCCCARRRQVQAFFKKNIDLLALTKKERNAKAGGAQPARLNWDSV